MNYVTTNTMSVSPEAIANEFIDLSKKERHRSVSNLKLQKLVYIAHGFHLGLYKEPLSKVSAQTWQYGPVFPQLYRKLRKYGAGEVADFVDSDDWISKESREAKLIKKVWDSYKHHSAGRLMARTHKEGTPWDKVWKEHGNNAEIPDFLIGQHFEELIHSAEEKALQQA